MDYDVGSSIHSEERGIGYDSPPAIIRTTRELESLSLNQLPTLPTSQELHGLVSLSTLSRWASDAGFLIGDGNVSLALSGAISTIGVVSQKWILASTTQ